MSVSGSWVFEVAAHLAQGRLVPVLPAFPPPAGTLAVLMPGRRLVPLKVRAFADLLVDQGRRVLAGEEIEAGQGAAPGERAVGDI